jgi:hypothetical protein
MISMSERRPVFIDGPLKGRNDIPLPAGTLSAGFVYQPTPVFGSAPPSGPAFPDPVPVLYRFHEVRLFGRTLLAGSAGPPDDDDAFEVLCSDLAKEVARIPD